MRTQGCLGTHGTRARGTLRVGAVALALMGAAWVGCSAGDPSIDAGTPDASTPDASTPDASTPDAGTPDASTPDASTPDAGTPDASTPDAGTPDAGTPDAGTPDAGTPATVCGDGVVDAPEVCDDGRNLGAPGGCAPTCLELAPPAEAFPAYMIQVIDRDGAPRTRTLDRRACAPSLSTECAGLCMEDADHCADVAYLGGGEWRLDLRVKSTVARVPILVFPAQPTAEPLDSPDDDVYLYPFLSGVAERYDHRTDPNATFALTYPGGTFAPLTMLADRDDARLVYASNWPPIAVSPAYGAGRLTLWYQDAESTSIGGGSYLNGWTPGLASTPRPGETRSYRFTEVRISPADVPPGHAPWHVALDRYRAWLRAHTGPVSPPPAWMRESHGVIGVQLENLRDYDPALLDRWATRWGRAFPWMLLWGQMSDYLGDCCETAYAIHPRYGDLPGVVRGLRDRGMHVGYYSAPNWRLQTDPAQRLHEAGGARWLRGWIDSNLANGADAHYVDTLARTPWGSPDVVRELFAAVGRCDASRAVGGAVEANCGLLPQATMIEGAVDIYPAAGLMDGGLTGVPGIGMADNTQPLSVDRPYVTFPQLVYDLLDSHQLHLGGYNNDYGLTGTIDTDGDSIVEASDETPRWYWSERQAFLLGARITGSHLDVWLPGAGLSPNPRLEELIAERDRMRFWARGPRYRDTRGLGPAPRGVDARRFETADGGTLLAVVNWDLRAGLTIDVDGVPVPLCARRFAILDVASPSCPP